MTARGLFSAEPVRLSGAHRGSLRWWAGPWPVDERWWESAEGQGSDGQGSDRPGAGRTARAQVLIDGEVPRALLLCYRRRRWYVEGVYE